MSDQGLDPRFKWFDRTSDLFGLLRQPVPSALDTHVNYEHLSFDTCRVIQAPSSKIFLTNLDEPDRSESFVVTDEHYH